MSHRRRALRRERRPSGAPLAMALLLLVAGCGGDKAPASREELPQLDEAAPEGWVQGSLAGVHVLFDTLPWVGPAVVTAERPTGGFLEPQDGFAPVEETEQRHGAASGGADAVEPRIALRFAASTPATRLGGALNGVSRLASMGDVWIACRNASNESGWVRLPMLFHLEPSSLSWDPVPPGEEVPGVHLEFLPSKSAVARLRDRSGQVPEEQVWKRLGRLIPIEHHPRVLHVWIHPTLSLQQVLVSLRKLEAVSDASLVVSVSK